MKPKSPAQAKVMRIARRKSAAAYGERRDQSAKALAARNSYRAILGLPPVK